jgi:hypothetical protein
MVSADAGEHDPKHIQSRAATKPPPHVASSFPSSSKRFKAGSDVNDNEPTSGVLERVQTPPEQPQQQICHDPPHASTYVYSPTYYLNNSNNNFFRTAAMAM